MRYRERNVSGDASFSYSFNHSYPSHTDNSSSGSGATTSITYDKMWDVEIPNFHKRRANGEVFFNPMHRIVYEASTTSGTPFVLSEVLGPCLVTYNNMDRIRKCTGIVGDTETDLCNISRLVDLARTKAWADINSAEFQGLVFLGELRETIGMIRRPLSGITKHVKGLYNGVPRGKSLAGLFADNWLAYRYGWRPLITDLSNAVSAVDKLREGNLSYRYTARGHAKYSNSEHVLVSHTGPCMGILLAESEYDMYQTAKVRANILYEIDYRQLFGLSFQEIPIAVWELLPYSFVADWFVNIGDYIQAITPKSGVKILGGSTTVEIDAKSEGVTTLTGTTTSSFSVSSPGSYPTSISRQVKTRTPGMGRPTLSLTSVYEVFDLGTARIADSLALIWGIINRRKP